ESNLMKLYLEAEGYVVKQAGNGREALEKMAVSPPDLITLDMMMPEMDGFQVLEQLKKNKVTRNIPVVILTAKQLSQQERDFLQKQVATVVSKADLNSNRLLEQIGALMRK
ncbi:MAG: response regulator, partial [Proteobacteria bacterium]|nr:response regulator [Pseudomonadota bacterium]MBU1648919.1 response regulator [Pseudomonadota bacterium]